jgi:hypothetical protein
MKIEEGAPEAYPPALSSFQGRLFQTIKTIKNKVI